MNYPRLFTPLDIGRSTLRNRVVFAAHLTNFAENGLPTDRHAAYYAARAAGGAGLIIVEEQSTHPSDQPYEKMIQGYRPAVIPRYRAITDAVHAHGALVLAQVNHNGGQSSGMYSGRSVLAPSAVPDPLFREVPHSLDRVEIGELVDGYVRVAEHCRDGGFDGVELQCSQSSLIRMFLARATNHRTDEYGGDLAGRARFLVEVVSAVRAALGPEMIVGVRLSGQEYIEGGIRLDEAVDTAVLVERTGSVDYINTAIGVATSTLHLIEASMATPHGYANFVPSAIRERVSLPVIGVGRFTTPEMAEQALADGVCDLVGIVRGHIADPEFANKAREGRAREVHTCLSCNQDCIGRVGMNAALECVVNPSAGRELLAVSALPASRRTVLIVGGGPAGLQAASSAAHAGHDVTLYERQPQTGGQVRTAGRAPHRAEFAGVVDVLEAECRARGVKIRTGVEVDRMLVLTQKPNVVVIATGANPVRPEWAGAHDHVVDVREVLDGTAALSGRVLIVDELSFHQATSTAEFLAERGCQVTVCTPGMVVGQDLGLTLDMEGWRRRAHEQSITCLTDVVPVQLRAGLDISLLHHPTGVTANHRFDWIVCSLHQNPEDSLWNELKGEGLAVVRIGDAVTPRRLDSAIREGERAAKNLAST
ncbi:mycofactocin system FadH/OYE family oxidoreductase 2 [Rhodococcus sp. 1168]|uniref:mycofactocin system FadH/OYE family oxidoreductase 2 n=1 Tax=Rhodococcus sp. 1168 TaxID=2018041 RepID=UPI000A0A40D0|nr:mycofactocin system FadH/OYE family oxidoreductase 2 [Rhodococcus sp. 1168]ORI16499.1 2,4-dienoyl-CoA reductase [Rhodococcus sp. 1168]